MLLNKVVLEYVPNYGQRLADEVRSWGAWVREQAEKELATFYPGDSDGSTPFAYMWARTVLCEGPNCGAEIPLLRSLFLERSKKRLVALRLRAVENKGISVEIVQDAKSTDIGKGTSAGGSATCPVCGYTTQVESVRRQLSSRKGGARDARLVAVAANKFGSSGLTFRCPTENDLDAVRRAELALQTRGQSSRSDLPLVPEGLINHLRGFFNVVLYGNTEWGDLFTQRQALTLSTFARLVTESCTGMAGSEAGLAEAVKTCLALILDRVAVRCTANCIWDSTCNCIMQIFNQGQSLPARWEFVEMSPLIDAGSGWSTSVDYTMRVFEHLHCLPRSGQAEMASAMDQPLPDDSATAIITDPPYYAAVPYSDLSDFFYAWLRRSLSGLHSHLLETKLVPKENELVSLAHRAAMYRYKDNNWFEEKMQAACAESRRVCVPDGLGVYVFANKETSAWEAMLTALLGAGWVVKASWPIDTESGTRLRAKESAALASSVHLVCRPRENPDGSLRIGDFGEWLDILQELPKRIHEWLPRLAEEGIVGADAIFACLGPALEIFSRHSRVERADGSPVTLREYLEEVWAAVSKEALSLLFKDADATGLEPDARLTAMWLWTLRTRIAQGPTATDLLKMKTRKELTTPKTLLRRRPGTAAMPWSMTRPERSPRVWELISWHLKSVVELKGQTARLRRCPNARRSCSVGKSRLGRQVGP